MKPENPSPFDAQLQNLRQQITQKDHDICQLLLQRLEDHQTIETLKYKILQKYRHNQLSEQIQSILNSYQDVSEFPYKVFSSVLSEVIQYTPNSLPPLSQQTATYPNETQQIQSIQEHMTEITHRICTLLIERYSLVKNVGKLKKDFGKQLYQPGRENQVYKTFQKFKSHPLYDERFFRSVYKEIMSGSLFLEGGIRIGYLGPEGSFSYQAACSRFGQSIDYQPFHQLNDVISSITKGKTDYAIVPIENSRGGLVGLTLDLLIEYDVSIIGEEYFPIRHSLLRSQETEPLKRIYSHPQALAQTRFYLQKNYPDVAQIECLSTSSAALKAADDPHAACIGSSLLCNIYPSLTVIAEDIHDDPKNITRFFILASEPMTSEQCSKTSFVFSLPNRPGGLSSALACFGQHNINILKIESRPSLLSTWEYNFYLDIEGSYSEDAIQESLQTIEQNGTFFKFFGSYPSGHSPQ